MKHKLLHCWDCGARVLSQSPESGAIRPDPNLQQVRFGLSDGSYMDNPFCATCAAAEWTPERIEAFRQAIVAVMPSFTRRIVRCEGPVPLSATIAGIVQ